MLYAEYAYEMIQAVTWALVIFRQIVPVSAGSAEA
jgi:hypothetical protein